LVSQPSALSSQLKAKRGFALLIVITLLSFVVVLLLGLAVYTRVETAVAGNTQRQAQARENALLGLNVALGQLQWYAGSDTRITAAAHNFGGIDGTRDYTGVWNADASATVTPATPMTWLVSGNEFSQPDTSEGAPEGSTIPAPLAVTPAAPGMRTVDLVGRNSTGSTSRTAYVAAPLADVRVSGVPGTAPNAESVIGRYAWWIGDQGVKASVALPDETSKIDYPPFVTTTTSTNASGTIVTSTSVDLRERIRQQIAVGAGAADPNGASAFEPRDDNNAPLVANQNVIAPNQIAFLKNGSSTPTAVGLATVQRNFHAWSPNNFAVLASTAASSAGLRKDLSLLPALLGSDVNSWLDYSVYMEPVDPAFTPPTGAPAISPPYSTDPLRRRYVMQGASPLISPVLSFCLLSFNVRTLPTPGGSPSASSQPLQVRLRGAFSLWNPYSSALVPDNLRLEITGLPATLDLDDVTNPASSQTIPFASLFETPGTPLPAVRFSLPWSSSASPPPNDDRHSWLPGRTYSWTIAEDTTGNSPPPGGYSCVLNSQDINKVSGEGVQQTIAGVIVDGSDDCHLETGAPTQFVVSLIAERASGDVTLASFTSPQFNPFRTTTRPLGSFTYTPTFVFRLAESDNGAGAWLMTTGQDLRESPLPGDAYSVGTTGHVNGPSPELYENVRTISAPDRLLDRDIASFSYDEDTPVFELLRAPLLSVGQLQHLPLAGQRPFAIGNSWVGTSQLNGINASEIFDRFFFSGLVGAIAPTTVNGLLLPNPMLKVLRDPVTGVPATAADLQAAPNGQSSKFLLQGGAFNINSTSVLAWAAVLRSVRFPAPQSFSYLDADFTTGTADDSVIQKVQSGDAQFFRFPQSAHETYKADDPVGGSTYAASIDAPSLPPNPTSTANTHFFRRGMRTLFSADVAALAQKIVELINAHHGTSGPFRTLEEFLGPASPGSPSLLEQAIVDADAAGAQINKDSNGNPLEFSSQFLTQGDIMTALAPVLFPRSDTFLIRAYGEAVNPATNATEGRAWCEALVQRVPEYFEPPNLSTATGDAAEVAPADLTSDLNKAFGRRFKVLSFRWLTRSDI
jgi:hypothetical protein